MKKFSLFALVLLPLLGGCSIDFSTQTELNVDMLVNSGQDLLSGVKSTANEYYQDQIKPTVDTAVEKTQEEIDKLKEKAKNSYNEQIDKANEYVQNQLSGEIGKLKVK